MNKNLNYPDLQRKEAKIIREWTLLREGLLEIRDGKFRWAESSYGQRGKKEMNILRRSYRLFATFKIIGGAYRLTRNVWGDYWHQLKKAWIKGQPESQKELNRIIDGKEPWN